jgi:predicted dehydrogenase
MNGVTGRMGYRQHLVRSLLLIRDQGGVLLDDGTAIFPEPVLVGRDEQKLRQIAERHGIGRWTTSLDDVLSDPGIDIYFDAQVTTAREPSLRKAIAAGKHVDTEKPVADSLDGAVRLARAAREAGLVHGVVQDKLFLPGVIKLRRLIKDGFFGRVLSVRLEFGYWVFEGDGLASQRPSWNYRKDRGGGIILDMFPHWQYLLEDLSAPSMPCTRGMPLMSRSAGMNAARSTTLRRTTRRTRCWSSPAGRSPPLILPGRCASTAGSLSSCTWTAPRAAR